MEQVVGIQFNGRGNIYEFSSGGIELALHDRVVAETEQGVSLGEVVSLREYGALSGGAPQESGSQEPDSPDSASAEPGSQEPGSPDVASADLASPDSDSPASEAPALESPDSAPLGAAFPESDSLEPDAQSSAPMAPAPSAPLTPPAASDTPAFAARDFADEGDSLARDLLPIVRRATEEDLETAAANAVLAREAVAYCRQCIRERDLDMKLVDVEVFFDRSKMVFYFTAPARIDFRDLVKDLVHSYRTRIELRQIGVRHETQMIGALGNCGMVCCCRRYLRKFAPVTIKMAKEQNLFLNPAKISGICGRLLCCLSYEQENYETFHRSCPRLGKRYQTSRGMVKVLRGNMFRNSLIVLTETNEEQEITLAEWAELSPRRPEPQPGQPQGQQPGQQSGQEQSPRQSRSQGSRRSAGGSDEKPEQRREGAGRSAARHESTGKAENTGKTENTGRAENADRTEGRDRPEATAPEPEARERSDAPDVKNVPDSAENSSTGAAPLGAAAPSREEDAQAHAPEDDDGAAAPVSGGIFGLRRAPEARRQGQGRPERRQPEAGGDGQRTGNRRKRRPNRSGGGQENRADGRHEPRERHSSGNESSDSRGGHGPGEGDSQTGDN